MDDAKQSKRITPPKWDCCRGLRRLGRIFWDQPIVVSDSLSYFDVARWPARPVAIYCVVDYHAPQVDNDPTSDTQGQRLIARILRSSLGGYVKFGQFIVATSRSLRIILAAVCSQVRRNDGATNLRLPT